MLWKRLKDIKCRGQMLFLFFFSFAARRALVALLSLEMFTYNSQIKLYKTLDKFEAQVYDIRVKEGKAVYA